MDRLSHIIDVKRDVMPAFVAVLQRPTLVLIRGGVLEDFKVGAIAQTDIAELLDLGTRVHVQMFMHPIAFPLEVGCSGEQHLCPQNIGKEVAGFVDVGNGDPDVFHSTDTRYRHGLFPFSY